MLEYERRLHLDKHYEQLQNALQPGELWYKKLIPLLWNICIYTITFYFLRYLMNYVPDIKAWENSQELFCFGSVVFLFSDLIYYAIGFLLICYGAIRLTRITFVNHRVQDNDLPVRLLTDGYYGKVRYPMYGTFVILYAAIFLAMRSLNGVIITCVFLAGQYVNAFMEEKKLRNIFGEEYMIYSKKTTLRILTKQQVVCLFTVMFVTIVGFVIK